LDLAIAQSEVWSQLNAQLIAETKRKRRLYFLAYLWSQSEFRTQRKTDPNSEMTRCSCCQCSDATAVDDEDDENDCDGFVC